MTLRSQMVLGVSLALVGMHLHAQSLCGVAKIARESGTAEDVNVTFHSRGNAKIQVVHDKGSADYELRAGSLITGGKAAASILARKNSKIYVVEGLAQSCVLHAGEQDGRAGFHIEEYRHVHGEPPTLRTEFVETL